MEIGTDHARHQYRSMSSDHMESTRVIIVNAMSGGTGQWDEKTEGPWRESRGSYPALISALNQVPLD